MSERNAAICTVVLRRYSAHIVRLVNLFVSVKWCNPRHAARTTKYSDYMIIQIQVRQASRPDVKLILTSATLYLSPVRFSCVMMPCSLAFPTVGISSQTSTEIEENG